MVQIRLSPDLRVVSTGLKNLSEQLRGRIVNDTSQRIAEIIEARTKQEVPVDSGRGRDSIDAQVEQSTRGVSSRIVLTGNHYLKYVKEGTQPHIIRPRNGRVLAWLNGNGSITFAQSVMHPGQQANDFVSRAWASAEPDVRSTLREAGLRAWRELSRFR